MDNLILQAMARGIETMSATLTRKAFGDWPVFVKIDAESLVVIRRGTEIARIVIASIAKTP